MIRFLIAAFLFAIVFAAGCVRAEDGVASDRIYLGQVCALRGPAGNLGRDFRDGLRAYFNRVNGQGGIRGRQIELETINDDYEPEKTRSAVATMIAGKKVFMLIGGVGTPTAEVAVPLCEQAKVPFVAPLSGAEFLRNPSRRYVVNLRPSYNEETEAFAKLLVDEKGMKNIGCLFQDDGYGNAGLSGIRQALERRHLTLKATGSYERNTIAIASGLNEIAAAAPEAVIMVGTFRPCATFVKAFKSHANYKSCVFCNLSFVGSLNFLDESGDAGDGTITAQTVPFPWDTSLEVLREFQDDMRQAGLDSSVGFVSLEGYLAAKLTCTAIQRINGDPTRENFLDAIDTGGEFDLGGIKFQYSKDNHQGSKRVYLTVIRDGKFEKL